MERNTSNRVQSFFLQTSPQNDTAPSPPGERLVSRCRLTGCISAPSRVRGPAGKVDMFDEEEVVFALKTHGCPFSYKAFHGAKFSA